MSLLERLFWSALWLMAGAYCFVIGYGSLMFASDDLPWPLLIGGWMLFGIPMLICFGGMVMALSGRFPR